MAGHQRRSGERSSRQAQLRRLSMQRLVIRMRRRPLVNIVSIFAGTRVLVLLLLLTVIGGDRLSAAVSVLDPDDHGLQHATITMDSYSSQQSPAHNQITATNPPAKPHS
jgi:hypothetical protein